MAEVLLTEEQAETVERGDHARSLLDSPAFLEVIELLRAECAEEILTSNPQDLRVRENAYTLSRGLSAITERLISIAGDGEAILAQAEAETEQQETSEYTELPY